MRLLCIDDSDPAPELFYGKWVEAGKSYSGRLAADAPEVVNETPGVELDDLPGRPWEHNPAYPWAFRADRFVIDPELKDVEVEQAAEVAS